MEQPVFLDEFPMVGRSRGSNQSSTRGSIPSDRSVLEPSQASANVALNLASGQTCYPVDWTGMENFTNVALQAGPLSNQNPREAFEGIYDDTSNFNYPELHDSLISDGLSSSQDILSYSISHQNSTLAQIPGNLPNWNFPDPLGNEVLSFENLSGDDLFGSVGGSFNPNIFSNITNSTPVFGEPQYPETTSEFQGILSYRFPIASGLNTDASSDTPPGTYLSSSVSTPLQSSLTERPLPQNSQYPVSQPKDTSISACRVPKSSGLTRKKRQPRSEKAMQNSTALTRGRKKQSNPLLNACLNCRLGKNACEAKTPCGRCSLSIIIPCVRESFDDDRVKTFRKWLRHEYASKLVRDPSSHILDYKTVQLQHILGGPFVKISCYEFKPSSPPDPNETYIFWKEKWGWNESLTTCWSSKSLKHDLEPYVEQNVDIFVEEACKRSKCLAPIFEIALKLVHDPIIWRVLKLFVAIRMLMKGWSLSDLEHLGNHAIENEKSPWNGRVPAPRAIQNQFDHLLELLAVKLQAESCKLMWKTILKRQPNMWLVVKIGSILIGHIIETDLQRLKFWEMHEEQLNRWKHPESPATLVEKGLHFCNLFLLNFRVFMSGPTPLQQDWTKEETRRMVNNDELIINSMLLLQSHEHYLREHSLMGRKPRDTYEEDDDDCFEFTMCSLFLEDKGIAETKDFFGNARGSA